MSWVRTYKLICAVGAEYLLDDAPDSVRQQVLDAIYASLKEGGVLVLSPHVDALHDILNSSEQQQFSVHMPRSSGPGVYQKRS